MLDSSDLDTRKKIFLFIEQNPGVNLSTIAERLQLSIQLVDYHIIFLDRQELITIEKEGGYKRCYIKASTSKVDKRILALLRQPIPLQIILFLLQHPFARYSDIFKHLRLSSPRFAYHLRKLVNLGIITVAEKENNPGYKICNEQEIVELLLRYKPTTIFDNIEDTWEGFDPRQ